MRQVTITSGEAGQRFDKYLRKYLKEAPDSFLYKMLRKKNITLNSGKASGGERLQAGDVVCLYLSEETLAGFGAGASMGGLQEIWKAAGSIRRRTHTGGQQTRRYFVAESGIA